MVKRRETNLETLFQEALREQIGERRFSMWFGEGVRFVFSDSLLSVRVESSEFLCNWICSAFKHTLEQLCRDFCGRVLPVEFLYVGDGASENDGDLPNETAATRFVSSNVVDSRNDQHLQNSPRSASPQDDLVSFNPPTSRNGFPSARNFVANDASNAVETPKKRRGRPPKNPTRPVDSIVRSEERLFETTTGGLATPAFTPSPIPALSRSFPTFAENESDDVSAKSATNRPANASVGGDVPQEPRRRRGRPRKTPIPELDAEPVSAASVENSVPIRSAFDVSLANAADARRPNGSEVDGGSLPGGSWNLSESERVAWAAGDFNDSSVFFETHKPSTGSKTPGKRGRQKSGASTAGPFAASGSSAAAAPTLFDAAPDAVLDDEDVSRDERGFNIVKMAAAPQTRGKSDVSSANWASLDSFVEGFSNQLAKKVVEVAIVQPATMSPIFIYGPTSVGKTHLLEGVCDRYRRVPNRKPPLLMTAEEFTSAFIQSLRGGGAFRERFRDISLFALDDLHFLEGKVTTQTELLNVVDFLRARRVQMIFAANRPLSELTKLRGELTTRIESGVACKIETPERETLSAIFRQMAFARRLVVSDDVCRYVVSRFATHARQLSGALNRLYAAHLTTGAPINLDLAKDALADMAAANVRNIKLEDVERVVRETFGLDADSLKSKSRSKRCADPRALAMWLARKHTRSGLAEIGRYFGGRQHSAVVSAQKKVEFWLKTNEFLDAGGATVAVAEAVERMERSLSRPRV